MRLLYFLTVVLLFTGHSTNAKSRENSISEKEDVSEEQAQVGSNWINLEYINCLNNDLPCSCLTDIDYILIEFNVKSPNDIKLLEPKLNIEELLVKISENNIFKVYTHPEASDIFFSFTITGDTMIVSNGEMTQKYIRYKQVDNSQKGAQFIGKLNVLMLQKLINSKNFDIKKELGISEESLLHCNIGLGNINLLYKREDCNNKWILEKDEDKLLIYKYINSCDGKMHPTIVDKKIVYTISIK